MPWLAGVSTSSAPYASSSRRRSMVMDSGMVRMMRYPLTAATMASPMPVLPLVGSTMVMPFLSLPVFLRVLDHGEGRPVLHAPARIGPFELRPDLGRRLSGTSLFNFTIGVFPMRSSMLFILAISDPLFLLPPCRFIRHSTSATARDSVVLAFRDPHFSSLPGCPRPTTSHRRACRKNETAALPFTASRTSSTICPRFISTTRKRSTTPRSIRDDLLRETERA